MADPNWQRLKELFLEAITRSTEERTLFIERKCGENASLKAELELLLEAHAEAPDFLEDPSTPGSEEFLQAGKRVLRNAAAPPTPPEIPDYEVVHFIDGGAFGQTWLVKERLTGRPYAAKILSKETLTSELELDGIRSFKERAVGNRHLVSIEHVGETQTHYFYVMELAEDARGPGPHPLEGYEALTLDVFLRRRGGALPPLEAIDIAGQIVGGLESLHSRGLLHRDIKPANIVRGVDGHWKLCDLGLIKNQMGEHTEVGTPAYAPPGGARNQSDDLYAAGRVLGELVRATDSTSPEGGVSRFGLSSRSRIARTVERACHADPKRRFQNAAEMRESLESSRIPRRLWALVIAVLVIVLATPLWRAGCDRAVERSRGDLALPSGESLLEVHVLWSKRDGTYGILTHDTPLAVGTFFQVHFALERDGYAYLYYLTGEDPPFLLFPKSPEAVQPVREVYSPSLGSDPGQQVWHEVGPPAGTNLLLLLVSDTPIHDLEAMERELAFADIPQLEPRTMLAGSLHRPTLFQDTERSIIAEAGVAKKGRLQLLDKTWRARFREIRVIAFPIVGGEKEESDDKPK